MTLYTDEYHHLQSQILTHARLAASAPNGRSNTLTCLSPSPPQHWQAHVLHLRPENHFSILNASNGPSELAAMRSLLADIQQHNARVLGEVATGRAFWTEQRDGMTLLHVPGEDGERAPAVDGGERPTRGGLRESIRRVFGRGGKATDDSASDVAPDRGGADARMDRNDTSGSLRPRRSGIGGSVYDNAESLRYPGLPVWQERAILAEEQRRREVEDSE